MTTNIFTVIAENDDHFEITPREKILKKASKKMKEIEILKEKGKYHSLTIDECNKIMQEFFWSAFLYEEKEVDKPNIKEEKKRKKEEEKRMKEKNEKQREEEKIRLYEETMKREELRKEELRKEEMKREEDKKRKNLEKKINKKIKRDSKQLENEYRNLLLLYHGNNNKTFRILSLKYHPDKNVDRIPWANEMQKKLGYFREIFSNNE